MNMAILQTHNNWKTTDRIENKEEHTVFPYTRWSGEIAIGEKHSVTPWSSGDIHDMYTG